MYFHNLLKSEEYAWDSFDIWKTIGPQASRVCSFAVSPKRVPTKWALSAQKVGTRKLRVRTYCTVTAQLLGTRSKTIKIRWNPKAGTLGCQKSPHSMICHLVVSGGDNKSLLDRLSWCITFSFGGPLHSAVCSGNIWCGVRFSTRTFLLSVAEGIADAEMLTVPVVYAISKTT